MTLCLLDPCWASLPSPSSWPLWQAWGWAPSATTRTLDHGVGVSVFEGPYVGLVEREARMNAIDLGAPILTRTHLGAIWQPARNLRRFQ